MNTCSWKISR